MKIIKIKCLWNEEIVDFTFNVNQFESIGIFKSPMERENLKYIVLDIDRYSFSFDTSEYWSNRIKEDIDSFVISKPSRKHKMRNIFDVYNRYKDIIYGDIYVSLKKQEK